MIIEENLRLELAIKRKRSVGGCGWDCLLIGRIGCLSDTVCFTTNGAERTSVLLIVDEYLQE